MKLNVSVDLEDFFDTWDNNSLKDLIISEIKNDILKGVKRDPRYKAFIANKQVEFLESLSI